MQFPAIGQLNKILPTIFIFKFIKRTKIYKSLHSKNADFKIFQRFLQITSAIIFFPQARDNSKRNNIFIFKIRKKIRKLRSFFCNCQAKVLIFNPQVFLTLTSLLFTFQKFSETAILFGSKCTHNKFGENLKSYDVLSEHIFLNASKTDPTFFNYLRRSLYQNKFIALN